MQWTISVDSDVPKRLAKFPKLDAERIRQVIRELAHDPFAGDFGKLTARGLLSRRRVGAYRIVLTINQHALTVRVHDVVRRTTTTYR